MGNCHVHPLPASRSKATVISVWVGSSTLTASGGSTIPEVQELMAVVSRSHQMQPPYTVTVTSDHGCVSTGTVTVTVHHYQVSFDPRR